MGKPTRSINYNERSGFKYLRLCVSKLEVFTPRNFLNFRAVLQRFHLKAQLNFQVF